MAASLAFARFVPKRCLPNRMGRMDYRSRSSFLMVKATAAIPFRPGHRLGRKEASTAAGRP